MKHQPAFRALLALSAVLLLIASVPAAAAQTQKDFWSSTDRKFYLHINQYCDTVPVIRFIDEFNWPNDLDGCGGDVLNPTTSKWTDVYPSHLGMFANVTSATTAEFHLFLLSRAVDQTSVEAKFDLGYATCAGTAAAQVLVQEKVGGFKEFTIPCTFAAQGTANPLARPNLTVIVSATHTYGVGVEDPHASYVILHNVQPEPPKVQATFYSENERPVIPFEEGDITLVALNPNATTAAKSPGLGVEPVLLSLAVGLVACGRFLARRDV